MSHLFRPLGRDMESLDHVSWESHGKEPATSRKALMTLAPSSFHSTNEEHFGAEIIYRLRGCRTQRLKVTFHRVEESPCHIQNINSPSPYGIEKMAKYEKQIKAREDFYSQRKIWLHHRRRWFWRWKITLTSKRTPTQNKHACAHMGPVLQDWSSSDWLPHRLLAYQERLLILLPSSPFPPANSSNLPQVITCSQEVPWSLSPATSLSVALLSHTFNNLTLQRQKVNRYHEIQGIPNYRKCKWV